MTALSPGQSPPPVRMPRRMLTLLPCAGPSSIREYGNGTENLRDYAPAARAGSRAGPAVGAAARPSLRRVAQPEVARARVVHEQEHEPLLPQAAGRRGIGVRRQPDGPRVGPKLETPRVPPRALQFH